MTVKSRDYPGKGEAWCWERGELTVKWRKSKGPGSMVAMPGGPEVQMPGFPNLSFYLLMVSPLASYLITRHLAFLSHKMWL